jgi:hypothetical protein
LGLAVSNVKEIELAQEENKLDNAPEIIFDSSKMAVPLRTASSITAET